MSEVKADQSAGKTEGLRCDGGVKPPLQVAWCFSDPWCDGRKA